jgi:phospholipase/carboxylesterase
MSAEGEVGRREFVKLGAVGAGLIAVGAIGWSSRPASETGRLDARPHKPKRAATPGEHVLSDADGRRSILYVPSSYDATKPAPFLLALHGATGSGDSMLRGTRPSAEAHGVVVLSPSSRGGTWDAIRGRFGDDVSRIDKLLAETFDRCAVDPAHVAVGGFSDGASYGLSLGLLNGDLFTHIIAHSPGFIIPGPPRGKPKIFISHGRQDPILPIDQCSRVIVSQLRATGYSPRFDEFDGGHAASPEMRERAMSWFAG